MGACSFIVGKEATSADEAFRQLCEEAAYNYGHNAYSGKINTCDFYGRATVLADKYAKAVEAKAQKMAYEQFERMRKYQACCYDLGVVYYNVMSVKKDVPEKQKIKWVQKYVVIDARGLDEDIVFKADTKKPCEEYIRQHIFSGRQCLAIAKRPVPQPAPFGRNKDYLARYSVSVKQVNKIPKNVPSGSKVEAVHRYLFYGIAAE